MQKVNCFKDFKETLEGSFTGELYEKLNVEITTNEKKARTGAGAVCISVKPADTEAENYETIKTTVYIINHTKSDTVIFVNDHTHDVIFNNIGVTALEKSVDYIVRFIERSCKRLLGIEIPDSEPRFNKVSKSKYGKTTQNVLSEGTRAIKNSKNARKMGGIVVPQSIKNAVETNDN